MSTAAETFHIQIKVAETISFLESAADRIEAGKKNRVEPAELRRRAAELRTAIGIGPRGEAR